MRQKQHVNDCCRNSRGPGRVRPGRRTDIRASTPPAGHMCRIGRCRKRLLEDTIGTAGGRGESGQASGLTSGDQHHLQYGFRHGRHNLSQTRGNQGCSIHFKRLVCLMSGGPAKTSALRFPPNQTTPVCPWDDIDGIQRPERETLFLHEACQGPHVSPGWSDRCAAGRWART